MVVRVIGLLNWNDLFLEIALYLGDTRIELIKFDLSIPYYTPENR